MDAAPRPTPPAAHHAAVDVLRVLLIAPESFDVAGVTALLAPSGEEDGLELEVAHHLDRAVARLGAAGQAEAAAPISVVLLALPFADRPGIVPFVALRARARATAIVILCAAADEPLGLKAVQLGASDYLIGEQLYRTLVVRCLRHAVETERVRELLAHTQARAPRFEDPEKDPAARPASLRAALPEEFTRLVQRYGQCLDDAVEQALYRVEHPIAGELSALAAEAGELRAAPRDVVEIHAATLKERTRDTGPQRLKLYTAEGRLRLLELMGYLAAYYRAACLAAEPYRPSPSFRDRP